MAAARRRGGAHVSTLIGAGFGVGFGGRRRTPITILKSALASWHRADLGVTIGTGVVTWADQKAEGDKHFVQAVAGSQPTWSADVFNGRNSLKFLKAHPDFMVQAVSLGLNAWTIGVIYHPLEVNVETLYYLLGRDADAGGDNGLFVGGSYGPVSGFWGWYDGTTLMTATALVANTPTALVITHDGAGNYKFHTDRSATVVSKAGTARALAKLNLGRRADGFWPIQGHVREIVVANGAATGTTLQALRDYLCVGAGI